MAAYWLTYKPLSSAAPRGWPQEEMDKLVRAFEANPETATPLWRIASSRSASPGDTVYLFRQGNGPRGIFGWGELIEAPRDQTDPTDTDAGPTSRARIRLFELVNPSESFLLGLEELVDIVPGTLVDAQQSGNRVPDAVAAELELRLSRASGKGPTLDVSDADDNAFDPNSVGDHQERALRAIRIRRGQPEFRAALLKAYGGRCAMSGCAVQEVLEAAHISPYAGRLSNHVSNGLLLRTDLHTLFDCGLIAVEPKSRKIVLAEALLGSTYEKLAGRTLRSTLSVAEGPSRKSLEGRYASFRNRKDSKI